VKGQSLKSQIPNHKYQTNFNIKIQILKQILLDFGNWNFEFV